MNSNGEEYCKSNKHSLVIKGKERLRWKAKEFDTFIDYVTGTILRESTERTETNLSSFLGFPVSFELAAKGLCMESSSS